MAERHQPGELAFGEDALPAAIDSLDPAQSIDVDALRRRNRARSERRKSRRQALRIRQKAVEGENHAILVDRIELEALPHRFEQRIRRSGDRVIPPPLLGPFSVRFSRSQAENRRGYGEAARLQPIESHLDPPRQYIASHPEHEIRAKEPDQDDRQAEGESQIIEQMDIGVGDFLGVIGVGLSPLELGFGRLVGISDDERLAARVGRRRRLHIGEAGEGRDQEDREKKRTNRENLRQRAAAPRSARPSIGGSVA
uniref:Uncharacterized protein n=1 Tax=Methylocapsa acidiphila TaxID=133552 RepID=Q2VNK5_METAI|nr:hypothetical protein orf76 [Methylocapsa acidiphila]